MTYLWVQWLSDGGANRYRPDDALSELATAAGEALLTAPEDGWFLGVPRTDLGVRCFRGGSTLAGLIVDGTDERVDRPLATWAVTRRSRLAPALWASQCAVTGYGGPRPAWPWLAMLPHAACSSVSARLLERIAATIAWALLARQPIPDETVA